MDFLKGRVASLKRSVSEKSQGLDERKSSNKAKEGSCTGIHDTDTIEISMSVGFGLDQSCDIHFTFSVCRFTSNRRRACIRAVKSHPSSSKYLGGRSWSLNLHHGRPVPPVSRTSTGRGVPRRGCGHSDSLHLRPATHSRTPATHRYLLARRAHADEKIPFLHFHPKSLG